MCYLVTASPPSATTGIKVDHLAIFDTDRRATDGEVETPQTQARFEAERLVKAGFSGVRVWKLEATPRLEQQVVWS